jgi:organic radical activating enzyme
MKPSYNEDNEFLGKFFESFELQEKMIREKRFPRQLAIEVPSNCYPGKNCIFCSRKDNEEKPIDIVKIGKRIEEGVKSGIRKVVIAGSEPFNHPQIMDIIQLCSKYFEEISTFGLPERMRDEKFVDKIKKVGITEISMPIYSASRDEHNLIVGKNNFDDTILSVMNLKKAGISVFAHSILLKKNIGGIAATQEYVKNELAIPFIVIPFRPKKGLDEKDILAGYLHMIKALKGKGITSLAGFPLCVQKEIQEEKVPESNISGIMKCYLLLQKFHKLKKCRECVKYEKCNGLFIPFAAKLDSEAINPFKN